MRVDVGGEDVLQVVTSMSEGGMSRYVLDLVKNLDARGYGVRIVCTHFEGPYFAEASRYVKSIECLHARNQFVKLFGLFRVMRRYRPRVVHFHTEPVAAVAAWLARIPIRLETVHQTSIWVCDGHFLLRMLRNMFTSCHIVNIPEDAETLGETVRREKVTVLSPGVDPARILPVKGKAEALPGIPSVEERFVVGTIARLDRPKGIVYLVQAFALILSKCPNALLLLVGDGPLRGEVDEKIRELQLGSRVELTGYVHDAVTMLGGIDVFVLPSISESFGFGAAEAMVAGRPVIASDISGPNSFIENRENGILVPAGDPQAIAEAILELWVDPALRDKLGLAGRQKILETYSMRKFTDAYLKRYGANSEPGLPPPPSDTFRPY